MTNSIYATKHRRIRLLFLWKIFKTGTAFGLENIDGGEELWTARVLIETDLIENKKLCCCMNTENSVLRNKVKQKILLII